MKVVPLLRKEQRRFVDHSARPDIKEIRGGGGNQTRVFRRMAFETKRPAVMHLHAGGFRGTLAPSRSPPLSPAPRCSMCRGCYHTVTAPRNSAHRPVRERVPNSKDDSIMEPLHPALKANPSPPTPPSRYLHITSILPSRRLLGLKSPRATCPHLLL